MRSRTAGRPTARWSAQAYTLRADDDDFGQAGTLVREVWDDAQRERFVGNVAGHILGGVKRRRCPRVFEYWKNVDADTGKRIEEAVHAGPRRRRPRRPARPSARASSRTQQPDAGDRRAESSAT